MRFVPEVRVTPGAVTTQIANHISRTVACVNYMASDHNYAEPGLPLQDAEEEQRLGQ